MTIREQKQYYPERTKVLQKWTQSLCIPTRQYDKRLETELESENENNTIDLTKIEQWKVDKQYQIENKQLLKKINYGNKGIVL